MVLGRKLGPVRSGGRESLHAVPSTGAAQAAADSLAHAGFAQGVGQGVVGVAANPISGVLEAVSTTFEGMDATTAAVLKRTRAAEQQRTRLQRPIGGDHRLLPFLRDAQEGSTSEKQVRALGLDFEACPAGCWSPARQLGPDSMRVPAGSKVPVVQTVEMLFMPRFNACSICTSCRQQSGQLSACVPSSCSKASQPHLSVPQARVEAVGQALLRRAQEGASTPLGLVHMRGRRAVVAADAYEEHFLLPDDMVAMLTDRRHALLPKLPGLACMMGMWLCISFPGGC